MGKLATTTRNVLSALLVPACVVLLEGLISTSEPARLTIVCRVSHCLHMTTLSTSLQERLGTLQRAYHSGGFHEAKSGGVRELVNPATGECFTRVAECGPEDVDVAVRSARAAFESPAWHDMDPSEREAILWRIADGMDARREEFGMLETLCNGKTLNEGVGDVAPSSDIFRYYAGWVRKIRGETIPVDGPHFVFTQREPVGVCGLIVPWNYPLLMASWKVAPALAAGCTVVLKPAEWTPLTALLLAEVAEEAGLPSGVLNVIPGDGKGAGASLSAHPDVDKLAFTGSASTARTLLRASADSNLKKLSLELGGKSPLLIFPDADLDEAVNAAFWGIYGNKGEVCSASSRVIVHRDVETAFLSKIKRAASEMRVGDPLDTRSQMGAIVSQVQYDKVLAAIELGKQQGATLVAGGKPLKPEGLENGLFIAPTVFADVKAGMALAQEEVFGPVLSVLSFSEEGEAISLANDTSYGLCAAVFTRDVTRAHRVSKALKSGVVWVNRWNGFDSAAPFGGTKQSGWGREMGQEALELYLETKCTWINLSK